jgi:hypothetical protein
MPYPGRIVAEKGKRYVGAITSLEKGKTITVLCCVSASGTYVPPMIFPRVRMKPAFMDKAPTGSLGVASKSGWINEELFTRWFDHFLEVTQPAACQSKTLLIVDGHSSHVKNFDVIAKARDNNVIILCLPSHCTHRLQPLDVSFFKPLNARYNSVVQTWHRQQPGRPVTEAEFGELFNSAYSGVASLEKAQSGFQKTGLYPFNRNVLTDDDFLAAEATDQPMCIDQTIESNTQKSSSDQTDTGEQQSASRTSENPETVTEVDVDQQIPEQPSDVEPSSVEPSANNSHMDVDDVQPTLQLHFNADEIVAGHGTVEVHMPTRDEVDCNAANAVSAAVTFAQLVKESATPRIIKCPGRHEWCSTLLLSQVPLTRRR